MLYFCFFSSFIFFLSFFLFFNKKLLVLLSIEGLMFFFLYSYFFFSYLASFNTFCFVLFSIFIVLDSVLGVSVLLKCSRGSSYFFSNFEYY